MLFNEIYSSYFNVVADVLSRACEGRLGENDINEIIEKKAFGESVLNIPRALNNQEWKLLTKDGETPLLSPPTMPLTTLQKQWLKALLSDPRIKLFNPSTKGLEDVEPLYRQEWLEYFDRYSDGDDYESEQYIENFRLILQAFREYRRITVKFKSHRGRRNYRVCIPYRLEYSSKDDKFRLIVICDGRGTNESLTVNLSRLKAVKLLGHYPSVEYRPPEPKTRELTVELVNERNCLERFMLHFSHLEKEAEKIDNMHYRIKLKYDRDDETEILIRIISFGAKVKVTSPERFIKLIKERLNKQTQLGACATVIQPHSDVAQGL